LYVFFSVEWSGDGRGGVELAGIVGTGYLRGGIAWTMYCTYICRAEEIYEYVC
jgi:hypothetical protein